MSRRVKSLSKLILVAKPSLLDQVAYGSNFLKVFSSEALNPDEYLKCGKKLLLEFTKPFHLSNIDSFFCPCNFWMQTDAGITSQTRSPTINFVLGGPGVGKGTQCTRIAETYGFTHLSVGDLLRKEISSSSVYGDMILETITKGKIVSSEVTVKLLKSAIESGQTDRFLVDGFPRSEENRVAYEQIIGIEPDVVLFFDCNEEEMMKRVLHRNQGRVDDNIGTTKERLRVFEAYSLPVIKHYSQKGKLHKVNAIGTEDEIFVRLRPIFAT